MSLSEIDRNLLDRCLERKPRCWEDFVDRFLGLVVHVVHHTAQARSVQLNAADQEDLCADVFMEILKDDFGVLRAFRCDSSLATYLTVIARRVVVRGLVKMRVTVPLATSAASERPGNGQSPEQRISDRDEVQRLLAGLDDRDAEIVRLYHLEGQSYTEISSRTGMPENSIGPALSRAREKMRQSRRVAE